MLVSLKTKECCQTQRCVHGENTKHIRVLEDCPTVLHFALSATTISWCVHETRHHKVIIVVLYYKSALTVRP